MFGDHKWHLFRIAGHDVYMTPAFLIILAVLGFANVRNSFELMVGLVMIPVVFVSILLHELGHATASKRLGWGNSTIMFWGMGGLAINAYQGYRHPKKEIIVSLAGPAVSILLGLLSLGVLYATRGSFAPDTLFVEFLNLMVFVNLFWGIFNLLPIYPMDGGQATLKGLELWKKSKAVSAKITGTVGLVTLVLGVMLSSILSKNVDMYMLLMIAYFGYLNYKLMESKGRPMRWV